MKNLRILLVEDDPGLSLLFQRMLARLGHSVVDSVPLRASVLDRIRQSVPDLILVDVVMTDTMDSLELLHEVTSGLGIPGILISNYGLEQLLARRASILTYQFLRKPFFVEQLAYSISQALWCASDCRAGQPDSTHRGPERSEVG